MTTDMSGQILHVETEQLDELFSNIDQRTEALNKEFVDKINALRTYANTYPKIEDEDILSEIDELETEFRQRLNQKLDTMDGDINIPVMFEIYSTIQLIVETLNHKADSLRLHMILLKGKYTMEHEEDEEDEKRHDAKLISPLQKDAFTEPVMHKMVLSKIDFELPDEVWDAINDGFSYYWNEKVGFGNTPYFNDACDTIFANIKKCGLIFPFDNVVKIVDIMFDFIEQIPGATLDDTELVIPKRDDD
jgi:hypothetical protein